MRHPTNRLAPPALISGGEDRITITDPAYISASAALSGSVICGFTLAASWLSQNAQARAQQRLTDKGHREALYTSFIYEASRLYAHALVTDKAELANIVGLYATTSLTTSHPPTPSPFRNDFPRDARKGPRPKWSRLEAGEHAMQIVRSKVIIRGVAVSAAAPLLTSCSEGVLSPHGPIGKAELLILYDATAIMLAVVIPVILLTIGFAWWFRAGNSRARYLPNWEYSGKIEMIVWSIPTLVIVFLGGIAWIGSHNIDPPRAIESGTTPLDIDVVSLDWKWLFIYPNQAVASVNRLVVPAGTPVRFRLTSASVMNSFFVPELGSQIYTMPGMTTRLNLQADDPGEYQGFSAQFSGDGFSEMRFELAAVSADQFDAWVAVAKSKGRTLDAIAYDELALPSKAVAPVIYSRVVPGLFEAISAGQAKGDCGPHQEH
jgi:cytochrome o ubiquinol oxidase subunit 2